MSAIETQIGVGDCPERPEGFGHVWAGAIASGDARNPCRFCGYPGRGDTRKGESGFFQEATSARTLTVATPSQSGTGDPLKAYPKGMTPEMAERAAAIVADKKRRDAEAVADGSARPGQLAGAVKGKRS